MKLMFIGERQREFGIVGPVSGVRYAVLPGQPITVTEADGEAIFRQYPALFRRAEGAKGKPNLRLVKRSSPVASVEEAQPEADDEPEAE